MSFAIHVPCSCVRNGDVIMPPFAHKLEIRDGIYDIKPEFSTDVDLEKGYDKWQFCEHNQVAIEMDIGQSIIGIKPYIKTKYGMRFKNLTNFLPDYNEYHSTQYDKSDLLKELNELKRMEPEYEYRWNQFIALVKVAIQNTSWVYF